MECPKCHHKIGKLDWSQSCRYCGTTLMFYNLEENLKHDAKLTELSFATTRILAAKAKAVFVGGALQIARLVMIFGCLGLLMIPFCTVNVSTVLCDSKYSFNLLETYNAVSGSTLSSLSSVKDSAIFGDTAGKMTIMHYLILAMAVVGILQLVAVCISMKNPGKLSALVAAFSAVGICVGVFSVVVMIKLCSAAAASGAVNAKAGFGSYAAIAGFAVMLVLNIVMCLKGIDVKYKPGDLYRADISKKIKKGEITVEQLPLPVFETEEEKKERLEELAQAEKGEKEEVSNG
ncbi:MAG: hypothetical protein MJ177_06850 [Clostridia bacterium]|nr:hypothetical protein [Clostridia bacterium]